MDSPKHKSRKEVSEKESKRSHRDRDKDDREHNRERNGLEKHHHRSSADKKSKDSSHHSVRDSREDRHKRKEVEGEREHKERGHKEKERSKSRVDERVRDRDDREAERDKDDKDRHREKVREKEREHEDKERECGVKEHERERERERKEKEKEREREDTEREKERERKEKEREREDKEREKERERKEKERERENKERERERERERKEKEREREDKERERERERKERAREKEREREDKERERERERKERERERERTRREREKEEERAREKEVDRIREKEKRRATSRDYSSDDSDVKGHEKKRRRREDDHKTRDSEKGSKNNKHRDKNEDGDPQKTTEDEPVGRKETTWEEDMAEEQKKLDEEMEKRRRRVQEWQELKRKREEHEMEKHGVASSAEEPNSGKAWTLEGDSDDEEPASGGGEDFHMEVDGVAMSIGENGDAMAVDTETEPVLTMSQTMDEGTVGAEDIDPLDAFMNSVVLPEVEKLNDVSVPSSVDTMSNFKEKNGKNQERPKKGSSKSFGRIISGEDSDSDYGDVDNEEDPLEDEDDEEFLKRVKKTKVEKLTIVDHSKIDYPPFRKNFHIEVKEIARMTSEEVSAWRKQLELKIHGKDVPKPVKAWHQTGLSTKILETIKKCNFERPMPIQAQALPVIMSGRDCIGIAKTGSGKTLAFVLPMLRHIKDQPPLMSGDGPIGLVMAPTRELVQQIHSDIKKFAKVVGLSCVAVYGGSGVAQQISDLKRGTEIVVCTPGRMIDILCTSSGKITNLRRVTYLVMDEADRMFDMGFEPQITRIVQNTRPDRQTVLFSATFPRQVETLARKVLNKPIEIQVGGRSVVNKDIAQFVEVRPENDRFFRLLELLGEWSEKGKILIFVQSQEKCDDLFRKLLKHGHPCLSLHGAKDQTDRESTITDFKTNVCNLLIATSVAARGLDVKELELVINFDVPNHYEDYVHRVGRTGRAGRKGCAITFIGEEDARYAPDLVKALELSEQVVPDDLKALAEGFSTKVNQGLEKAHGTGYGGSGFKFNEEEDEVRRAAKKAQAKEYGFEEDKTDSDDEDDAVKKTNDITQPVSVPMQPVTSTSLLTNGLPLGPVDVATRAMMNLKHNLQKIQNETVPEHFEAELEINDFPQNARWKVTHKETLGPISEWTGAAITTRGQYFPPGKIPGPGERKLYLFIEGKSEQYVKKARAELKRVLEDITAQTSSLPGSAQPGRYSVFS